MWASSSRWASVSSTASGSSSCTVAGVGRAARTYRFRVRWACA